MAPSALLLTFCGVMMMPYPSADGTAGHPLVATMLAGPVYFAGMGFAQVMADPQLVIAPDENALPIVLLLIFNPLTILIGALLAVLPNLFGHALMRGIGRHNVGWRLPPVWALVGGAIAGTVTMLFAPLDPEIIFAMSFTGAISALICRIGLRWNDDARTTSPNVIAPESPLSDAPSLAICAP